MTVHESSHRVKDAYDEGYGAYIRDAGILDNPYDEIEEYYSWEAWNDGWTEARDDTLQKRKRRSGWRK